MYQLFIILFCIIPFVISSFVMGKASIKPNFLSMGIASTSLRGEKSLATKIGFLAGRDNTTFENGWEINEYSVENQGKQKVIDYPGVVAIAASSFSYGMFWSVDLPHFAIASEYVSEGKFMSSQSATFGLVPFLTFVTTESIRAYYASIIQLLGKDSDQAKIMCLLFHEMKWTHISILAAGGDDTNTFVAAIQQCSGISVDTIQYSLSIFWEKRCEELRKQPAHIILVVSTSYEINSLLDEVEKCGLNKPPYQAVLSAQSIRDRSILNMTQLEGTLALSYGIVNESTKTELLFKINETLLLTPGGEKEKYFSSPEYLALWYDAGQISRRAGSIFINMKNSTIPNIEWEYIFKSVKNGCTVLQLGCVDYWYYGDDSFLRWTADNIYLYNIILQLKFIGASGPVSFSSDGSREPAFTIVNGRKGKFVDIGTADKDGIYITQAAVFQTGLTIIPPSHCQGTPIEGEFAGIEMVKGVGCDQFRELFVHNNIVNIIMFVFISITLFLLVLAMIIIYIFRSSSVIRCSSVIFLQLMCVGGILLSVASIFMVLPSTPRRCSALWWTLTLSFTLLFGSLSLKTYRIYRIFKIKRLDVVIIKDSDLLRLLGYLILIDFVIGLVHELVSSFDVKPYGLQTRFEYTYGCSSKSDSIFIGISVGIKAIMIVFASFLAFENRDIDKNFNESSYMAYGLYNCIFVGIVAISLLVFVESPDLIPYFVAFVMNEVVLVSIGSLIGSKCINVYNGKESTPSPQESVLQGSKDSLNTSIERSPIPWSLPAFKEMLYAFVDRLNKVDCPETKVHHTSLVVDMLNDVKQTLTTKEEKIKIETQMEGNNQYKVRSQGEIELTVI
jgi:hypothetical protein